MEQRRTGAWALWLAAAAVFAAVFFLLGTTVYSADDFWYSTFLDGGLGRWLALTKEHYETFNGRALVHAAAQLVLHFGSWLFALVGTALCVTLPLAAALAARRPQREFLPAVLLFGAGLLALPRDVLVEGVLWISAFFNYALPTVMVAGEILLLSRVCARPAPGPGALFACALTGFLCGATTEQSGLVATAVALFYVLVCLLEHRAAFPCPITAAVAAAAGVLSIFLSPATRLRLGQETGGSGLFAALEAGLEKQAEIFASGHAMPLLLALVFAAAALALAGDGRRWRLLLPGALLSCTAAVAPMFSPAAADVWFYGLDLLLLLAWALALVFARRRETGLLLLAALGSLCTLLPTDSAGPRTMLPTLLYCLAAMAALLPGVLPRLWPPLGAGLPVLAAVAALALRLPFFAGALENYRLDLANRAAAQEAQESGVLWYCVDYRMEYTHTKPFHDGYFYLTYLESEGLDPDTVTAYFYSADLPTVYAAGNRLASPALPDGAGGWLLPLRGIVETYGGSITLTDTGMTIRFGDQEYTLGYPSNGEASLSWQDDTGTEHNRTVLRAQEWFQTMLSEEVYSELFGLIVTVSPDGGAVTVEQ